MKGGAVNRTGAASFLLLIRQYIFLVRHTFSLKCRLIIPDPLQKIKRKPAEAGFFHLLFGDCGNRACPYACMAVNACRLITLRFPFRIQRQRRNRANSRASTTSDAKILINLNWHSFVLLYGL